MEKLSQFTEDGKVKIIAPNGKRYSVKDKAKAVSIISMIKGKKPTETNKVDLGGYNVQEDVVKTVKKESPKGRSDFFLNLGLAESTLRPSAKAETSSARGLFQHLDKTWLNLVEKYGEDNGIYSQDMDKEEILALRDNPAYSTRMAVALTKENEESFKRSFDREPEDEELYAMHFFGAGTGKTFIKAVEDTPNGIAENMFKRQAEANQGIFYDQDGSPVTLKEVKRRLSKKIRTLNTPPKPKPKPRS